MCAPGWQHRQEKSPWNAYARRGRPARRAAARPAASGGPRSIRATTAPSASRAPPRRPPAARSPRRARRRPSRRSRCCPASRARRSGCASQLPARAVAARRGAGVLVGEQRIHVQRRPRRCAPDAATNARRPSAVNARPAGSANRPGHRLQREQRHRAGRDLDRRQHARSSPTRGPPGGSGARLRDSIVGSSTRAPSAVNATASVDVARRQRHAPHQRTGVSGEQREFRRRHVIRKPETRTSRATIATPSRRPARPRDGVRLVAGGNRARAAPVARSITDTVPGPAFATNTRAPAASNATPCGSVPVACRPDHAVSVAASANTTSCRSSTVTASRRPSATPQHCRACRRAAPRRPPRGRRGRHALERGAARAHDVGPPPARDRARDRTAWDAGHAALVLRPARPPWHRAHVSVHRGRWAPPTSARAVRPPAREERADAGGDADAARTTRADDDGSSPRLLAER